MAGPLIGADQKIPDWLVQIHPLGNVETAIILGIKPPVWGFGLNDAILGTWF